MGSRTLALETCHAVFQQHRKDEKETLNASSLGIRKYYEKISVLYGMLFILS